MLYKLIPFIKFSSKLHVQLQSQNPTIITRITTINVFEEVQIVLFIASSSNSSRNTKMKRVMNGGCTKEHEEPLILLLMRDV